MKKYTRFFAVGMGVGLSLSSLAFAGEFVGYSTLDPQNLYRVVNAHGAVVDQLQADTVKRVDLRDGYAAVQTTFDRVSLIDETGKVLIDQVAGSQFLLSDTLLAAYLPNAMGAVYDHEGKLLYSGNFVKSIGIAKTRFAVNDTRTGIFTLYSTEGQSEPTSLYTQYGVQKALLSENFLATIGTTGMQLRDRNGSILSSDSTANSLRLSDEFAAYFDLWGTFHAFTAQGNTFTLSGIDDYGISDSMLWVHDSTGIRVYNQAGTAIFSSGQIHAYAASHDLIAMQLNTDSLAVFNARTGQRFYLPKAENFSLTDRLVLVHNGPGQYLVYSDSGRSQLSENDSTVVAASISNGLAAFQYSGLRAAKVRNASGETGVESTLLNAVQVNRIDLSANRDELNWMAF